MTLQIVSKSCFNLVMSRALRPFRQCEGLDDGTYRVQVSEEEMASVVARQIPGESFSDTIERVLAGRNF